MKCVIFFTVGLILGRIWGFLMQPLWDEYKSGKGN